MIHNDFYCPNCNGLNTIPLWVCFSQSLLGGFLTTSLSLLLLLSITTLRDVSSLFGDFSGCADGDCCCCSWSFPAASLSSLVMLCRSSRFWSSMMDSSRVIRVSSKLNSAKSGSSIIGMLEGLVAFAEIFTYKKCV